MLLTPPYGPATPFGRPSSVRKAPDPIPACRAAPFKQLKRKETIQKLCTRLEAFPRNPSSRMELFWTLFFFFLLIPTTNYKVQREEMHVEKDAPPDCSMPALGSNEGSR